jgi:predicted nucleic-acid-binding protein
VLAVDTNVLARAVLGDDARQTAVARRTLAAEAARDGVYVPAIVLIELAWVLDGAGLDRATVATTLETLLTTRGVIVEHSDRARDALAHFRAGPAGFADYWIAAASEAANCKTLVTFDRKLARDSRASLLTP